jgi:hypothetical protein
MEVCTAAHLLNGALFIRVSISLSGLGIGFVSNRCIHDKSRYGFIATEWFADGASASNLYLPISWLWNLSVLPEIKRVPLRKVSYAQNQSNSTEKRLRSPERKAICTAPHNHHAVAPLMRIRPKSATAALRPMVARLPRCM